MKFKFNLSRVVILTIIVVLLAIVYFLVKNSYTLQIDSLKNPVDTVFLHMDLDQDQKQYPEFVSGDYLVIEDPEDPVSLQLRDSIELMLSSLGQKPVYVSEPTEQQINSAKEGIIVTRTYLNEYDIFENLLDYADRGGLVVFAIRPEVNEVFKSVYQQLGIYEHYYYKDSKGFHAAPGLLSDGEYHEEDDWIYNSMIELHVRDECTVLAENNDGTPLIWYLGYGKGNILVMNNSLMTYKSSAGLMLSLIAKVKGNLMYPVINAKAFALESFPLPTDVNSDFLKEYYLRSGRSFLRELWWPSMVRIGSNSGIKFTAGYLTDYASEDFYDSEAVLVEEMDFKFYAKELARYSGEIAFTGFNQKPLYFKDPAESMTFVPWTSYDIAETRTADAINFFNKSMPDYNMYTFLPAERLIDEQGYELILKQFPNLQAICGDFTDKTRYYQNFDVDENGIVQFPVVTEGFQVSDMDRWDLVNTVTSKGVIFHSCDISELMLETDPNQIWGNISKDFAGFTEDYIGSSPLESLTVTQASMRVKDMLALDADIKYNSDSIDVKIKNMPEKASFMLLSFDGIPKNTPGVTCTKIHESKYLVTSTVDEFTLELKK